MRGPLQAILVVVACAVLSVLVQPLNYVGAAAVALVTLRLGPAQGAQVLGGALAAVGVLGFVLLGSGPVNLLLMLLALWGGVWVMAAVLRASVSLALAVQAGALLTLLGVVLLYLVVGDPTAFWKELVNSGVDAMIHQAGAAPEVEQLRDVLLELAPLMSGLVAAGSLFSLTLCLLLGRWWQSLLYNPGGFRAEFQALRLDRRLALAVVVLAAVGAFAEGGIGLFAADLALPLLMAFLLAGLALVHALFGRVRNAQFWLMGFYVMLLVLQPLILFVVLAALADSWLDFRNRAGRPV